MSDGGATANDDPAVCKKIVVSEKMAVSGKSDLAGGLKR